MSRSEIRVGELVRATHGRDKGELFLVVAKEGELLRICDGKRRKAANPKKKKQKHVESTGLICQRIAEDAACANNVLVRREIRELSKNF